MGEAKRRKQRGVYPDGGPLELFRVPDGKLGITIEVDDEAPSTMLFDADKVADLMVEVERVSRSHDYYRLVRGLAAIFIEDRRKSADLSGIAIGILWTALYHPRAGRNMRAQVARALRDKGKAHLSWRYSSKSGLALAIADQAVPLGNLLARAPRDRQFMYEAAVPPVATAASSTATLSRATPSPATWPKSARSSSAMRFLRCPA